MKSFVKENAKIVLTALITSIVCISGTAFAARMMNAKDIIFTATNANFKAGNVGDAIDGLYNEAQKEQIYSTEERVVGKWANGKPIYRRVWFTNMTNTETLNISEIPLDTIITLQGEAQRAEYSVLISSNSSSGRYIGYYKIDKCIYWACDDASFRLKYVLLEYTKTTDEAKS